MLNVVVLSCVFAVAAGDFFSFLAPYRRTDVAGKSGAVTGSEVNEIKQQLLDGFRKLDTEFREAAGPVVKALGERTSEQRLVKLLRAMRTRLIQGAHGAISSKIQGAEVRLNNVVDQSINRDIRRVCPKAIDLTQEDLDSIRGRLAAIDYCVEEIHNQLENFRKRPQDENVRKQIKELETRSERGTLIMLVLLDLQEKNEPNEPDPKTALVNLWKELVEVSAP